MAVPRQARSLQLHHEPDFHRRLYAAQRAAWAVMAAVVAAALLGVFGSGPLDTATADAPDGSLRLEHRRFGRIGAQSTLRVRIRTGPGAGGSVRLTLDHETLDRLRIDGITPQPNRAETASDGVTYSFAMPESDGRATVTIVYSPQRAGPIRGLVGLDDRPPLRFGQFVYP